MEAYCSADANPGFASVGNGDVGAKTHHNLALGRRDEALVEFRAALNCDPPLRPSRVALIELGQH